MREKLLWSLVIGLGLLLAFAHAQSPARSEAQVGRYQIVTVAGDTSRESQAFKIDTVTGKTWGKAYLIEGTAKTVAWAAIVDYPSPRQQK
jgi:hypothetical protein